MAARVVLGVQYGYESRTHRGSRPLRATSRLDLQLRHRPFDTATIEEEFGDQLRETFALQELQEVSRELKLTQTPVEPMDPEESGDAVEDLDPVWKAHSGGSRPSSHSTKKRSGVVAPLPLASAAPPAASPGSAPPAAQGVGGSGPASGTGGAAADVAPARWVIHPGWRPKVCWDLVVTAMVFFSVIELPFRIGFSVETSAVLIICDWVMDSCFVLDIVLTFFTGYHNECEVYVTNRRDIALRYLRGFFVVDVVSVLPIDHTVEALRSNNSGGTEFRVMRLLRLAKLARLGRLRRLTELLERHLHMHTLNMLKVMAEVVFLIHMLTCLCYWMSPPCADGMSEPCPDGTADQDRDWGSSWVRMFEIDRLDLGSRYLASFYLTTATLMAVGYGDIFPASTAERLFSIVVQLTGAIIFGFILSGVTNVIESSNPRGAERKKRNAEIKEWLQSRNLPPALRQGVWRHFQYLMTQRSIFKDEPEILRNIPTTLRNAIVEQICLQYVQKLQRIFGQEDRSLVAELAVLLQPLQVAYGECVVEAGEPPTDFFTVSTGTIEGLLDEEGIADLEELHKTGARSIPGLDRSAPPPPATERALSVHSLHERAQQTPARYTQMGSATSRRPLPHRPGGQLRRGRKPLEELLSPTGLKNGLSFGRTSKGENAEPDPDYVLVAIYQEAEALSDFPVSPVRLQGGDRRSELLALNKELLNNALMQFPGACERYSARQREVQVQLWEACISSELQRMRSPVHGTKARRMKSKILIGGEASEVARLNPEVFSYMRLDELRFEQVFATRTLDPETGGKVTDNETDADVLKRYIVPPHHSRKVKWDLFVGAMVLYSVMVIPWRFGFGIDPGGFSEAIDYTVDFLFFVDICLSFRTGYLDSEGGVNTIPSHIRIRYIRSWFLIDLISTLPWCSIVGAVVPSASQNTAAGRLLKFTRLTRMLKMARVIKIARLSKLAESSVDVSTTLIRLVGMCTKIFVPAHILACFWYYFTSAGTSGHDPCGAGLLGCGSAEANLPGPSHWIESQHRKYNLSHAVASSADTDSTVDKYVISLYWVFTTMTTVGYGDVVPTNNMERLFAVGVMLFGATVFGYIISTIAEMSNEHNRDALGLNMSLLRYYGTEQHFSERMQKLMRFHYGFWYQEMTPRQEESRLLAKLPPALRKEVIKYIHRHVISSIPLFRKQLPDWFVAAAVRLLEPQAFCAGEVIISEMQAGPRQDVFFVHGGHCESYWLTAIAAGASFRSGTGRRRSQAIKAEGPCVCGGGCEDECPGRLLDVYPPGSAFGYEFILQDSSFAPFIDHKKMMVRCSRAAPCFLYALRHGTLTDINRHYPEFGQVVQEVLGDTILREGRRWHKARKRRMVWLEDYQTSAPWLKPSSPRESSPKPALRGDGPRNSPSPLRSEGRLSPGTEESPGSHDGVDIREIMPPGAVVHHGGLGSG